MRNILQKPHKTTNNQCFAHKRYMIISLFNFGTFSFILSDSVRRRFARENRSSTKSNAPSCIFFQLQSNNFILTSPKEKKVFTFHPF